MAESGSALLLEMLYSTKGPLPRREQVEPLRVADVTREGRHVTFVGIHTPIPKACLLLRR